MMDIDHEDRANRHAEMEDAHREWAMDHGDSKIGNAHNAAMKSHTAAYHANMDAHRAPTGGQLSDSIARRAMRATAGAITSSNATPEGRAGVRAMFGGLNGVRGGGAS